MPQRKYLWQRKELFGVNVSKTFSLMFRHFSQLNIMFVGGPNVRKDYHIEEGEEVRSAGAIINLLQFPSCLTFTLCHNLEYNTKTPTLVQKLLFLNFASFFSFKPEAQLARTPTNRANSTTVLQRFITYTLRKPWKEFSDFVYL